MSCKPISSVVCKNEKVKYKVAKRANGTKWNEQWMFEFESLDPGVGLKNFLGRAKSII